MNKIIYQLGISWRDPERAEVIINKLQKSKKLVLATDYDGTLTPEAGGNWHNMRKALPVAGQKKHKTLYNEHIPLEKAGTLTDVKNRQWSSAALDLHVDHSTALSKIEEIIESLELRPGAIDFINNCRSMNMFIAVVSAGVETPIKLAADKFGLNFDKIIAAKLQFDDQGIVKSWESESLIVPGNKQEKLSVALNDIATPPDDLGFLVVGDKKHDSQMITGNDDNILRIMVGVDPYSNQQDIKAIWDAQFDGIVYGNNLHALNNLTRLLSTS